MYWHLILSIHLYLWIWQNSRHMKIHYVLWLNSYRVLPYVSTASIAITNSLIHVIYFLTQCRLLCWYFLWSNIVFQHKNNVNSMLIHTFLITWWHRCILSDVKFPWTDLKQRNELIKKTAGHWPPLTFNSAGDAVCVFESTYRVIFSLRQNKEWLTWLGQT